MKNKKTDNEHYREMYGSLFREVTKVEEDLTEITNRLKDIQCKVEEFFISKEKRICNPAYPFKICIFYFSKYPPITFML